MELSIWSRRAYPSVSRCEADDPRGVAVSVDPNDQPVDPNAVILGCNQLLGGDEVDPPSGLLRVPVEYTSAC
jgi:hypothetical protein